MGLSRSPLGAAGLLRSSGAAQKAALVLGDVGVVVVSVGLAYLVRFEGSVPEHFMKYVLPYVLVALATMLIAAWMSGLYHVVLRHAGVHTLARVSISVAASMTVLLLLDVALSHVIVGRPVPLGVVFMTGVLTFLGFGALRSIGRLWVVYSRPRGPYGTRVLVIGAGDTGSLLMRDIENRPDLGLRVVGFLDDDPSKQNMSVRGVRILGPTGALEQVVPECDIQEIIIAIPSLTTTRRRELLDACAHVGKKTRIIAGIATDSDTTGIDLLRQVRADDLLGRESVNIDVERISLTLTGKVVAVTGAAGSIGSELCRQVMAMRPLKLLLLEIDESRLYELYLECEANWPGVAQMHICDVRDDRKTGQIFAANSPEVVFHAAAYKHVPLMEAEPAEAVRANVLGTRNVVDACKANAVRKLVLISTDKAVEPRSVMGATKAVAEHLVLDAGRDGLMGVVVRFGNVLGSRGSVVPIFEEQLRRGGPVRVTHPEVTRYFMTIPEAARLVLQAQAMSEGGDILILDMGEPVRVVDVAQRMIVLSGVPTHIEFTGLRAGEKLHEVLVNSEEQLVQTECSAVMRLNCLPIVGDGYGEAIEGLLREARLGDSPELVVMLRALATIALGRRHLDY